MRGEASHVSTFVYAPLVAIAAGALTVWLIQGTTAVHIPFLAAAVGGIFLGIIDPKRGWIAALVQVVVLIGGMQVIKSPVGLPEIEIHSLIGAIGLTLAGSFIGAYIKRAFIS